MISALNRLSNGNIELTITIPKKRVKETYQKTLSQLAQKVEINGFRKGKAPLTQVEKRLGKKTITEELLKSLIPEVYLESVKEQNLKPILNPQVEIISLEENKDWQIRALSCELPEVKLGDYKSEIRKALATDKIWVPGKEKKDKDSKASQENKIEKNFKTLLEVCKVQIPEILIQDEVNRMLTRLIDQTAKLGLTIEQYLSSSGKTIEKLKEEYRQQAEETLKLELILSAVAEDQKVQVSEGEIDKMIQAVPDQKTRNDLNTPHQRLYLRQLLRKRRVIDNLAAL